MSRRAAPHNPRAVDPPPPHQHARTRAERPGPCPLDTTLSESESSSFAFQRGSAQTAVLVAGFCALPCNCPDSCDLILDFQNPYMFYPRQLLCPAT